MLADFLESRAIADIVLRRPIPDFFFDGLLAVAGIGVVAEPLRRYLTALRFEGLEEVGHGLWVVAGSVEDDGSHSIGLTQTGVDLPFDTSTDANLQTDGGSYPRLQPDTTGLEVQIEFIQRCSQPLESTITSDDIEMN